MQYIILEENKDIKIFKKNPYYQIIQVFDPYFIKNITKNIYIGKELKIEGQFVKDKIVKNDDNVYGIYYKKDGKEILLHYIGENTDD